MVDDDTGITSGCESSVLSAIEESTSSGITSRVETFVEVSGDAGIGGS